MEHLKREDPRLADLIEKESRRIENTLDLIAAENHPPAPVLEVLGSILTIKTIEGYPGRRFHGGCRHADAVERLAVERACRLFGAEHANVQPHSGTSANLAVYFSVLETGDRILSMHLPHGGHLSHGHPASATSRCFRFAHYPVDRKTERIDYDTVRELANDFRPRLLVAGASAYPRLIDYAAMADIARGVGAYLMVDMAHIAGLVAAGVIPSPVEHSDFVTFTCYKTLMGGRGGVVLCRKRFAGDLDRAVFPGTQGTSPVSAIAAKAFIFHHATRAPFVEIQERTLSNARTLSETLAGAGWRIVTGGTENHQVLLDASTGGLTGADAEQRLESVGIITNRNAIPADAGVPGAASGLRLGTAAMAARGMGSEEAARIGVLVDEALRGADREDVRGRVSSEIRSLCLSYPVYGGGPP